jgi:hypothetical protein
LVAGVALRTSLEPDDAACPGIGFAAAAQVTAFAQSGIPHKQSVSVVQFLITPRIDLGHRSVRGNGSLAPAIAKRIGLRGYGPDKNQR